MGSQDDSPEQLPGTTGSWGGAANCSRNSLATLRANCPASENAVNPAKGLGGPRAQAFARQEPQGGWGGPRLREEDQQTQKGWRQGPHQHHVRPPSSGVRAWSFSSGRVCPFIPSGHPVTALRSKWTCGVGKGHLPAWLPPKRSAPHLYTNPMPTLRVISPLRSEAGPLLPSFTPAAGEA